MPAPWSAAMQEEMQALMDNNTWTLEDMPADRSAVKCMWIFKKKFNSAGNVDRHRARLVAKGFSQRRGIDFKDTYAPVVRYESIRIFLALAAGMDMDMKQFDVRTAFLHGDLNEVIFMDQPAGYDDKSGKKCWLRKGLYGLKQAPRQWNEKFNSFLVSYGLEPSQQDPCIYVCRQEEKGLILLALYVDDGLLACSKPAVMGKMLKDLDRAFKIRTSDPDVFVGLEISRCRHSKSISVGQPAYIDRMLARFHMTDCKPVKTPGVAGSRLTKEDVPADEDDFPYREAVGSLMFAMTCTRPDIAFEVSAVARFVEMPASSHKTAVKRILRYLKGTRDVRIKYAGNNLELESFCDAGYIADVNDPRSQAGRIHTINSGAVSWSSSLMKLLAHSTTEAEYMAMDEACKDVAWLRQLLQDMTCRQDGPTPLWSDNTGAIALVHNGEYHPRTRHISVRYHYVRQEEKLGHVVVNFMPTEEMPADMLTKSLVEPALRKCRLRVNLISEQSSEVSE